MELEYRFKKTDYSFGTISKIDLTYDFGVAVGDESFKALELIESPIWKDTSKIDYLIVEINEASDADIFEYQVEGGHLGIMVDSTEVAFFNLLDRENEEENFSWSKEKFITFLEAFKEFIEEN